MIASVFIRRLKEGATFEDFVRVWEADQPKANPFDSPESLFAAFRT